MKKLSSHYLLSLHILAWICVVFLLCWWCYSFIILNRRKLVVKTILTYNIKIYHSVVIIVPDVLVNCITFTSKYKIQLSKNHTIKFYHLFIIPFYFLNQWFWDHRNRKWYRKILSFLNYLQLQIFIHYVWDIKFILYSIEIQNK